jgi:hypothetical protein
MTPACFAPSAASASRDHVEKRSCWLIAAPYSTWKSRWKSIGDLRVGALDQGGAHNRHAALVLYPGPP